MADVNVSIIIPAYNAEHYIGEAIESALTQKRSRCEIIVVNDGSTDGTLHVLRKYEGHVRLLSGPNRGGCHARNRGVNSSAAEFIQFLDADDILTPECVERKLAAVGLADQIVCSRVAPMGENANISPQWGDTSFTLPGMILRGTPPTSAPLHRRNNLLMVGGFREGLRCAQEYDLHLRLALNLGMKFRVIDHVGALIRSHPESLSRRGDARWTDAFEIILMDLARAAHQYPQEMRDALAQRLTMVGRARLRDRQTEKADKVFQVARSLSGNWADGAYAARILAQLAYIIGPHWVEALHEFTKNVFRR